MMKQCIQLARLSFVFFLFLFAAPLMGSAADSYLNDNGKLDFKVDRLHEDNQERNEKGQQETELDKAAIQLFNEEVEKQINEKQKKQKKEMKELNDSLFLNTKKIDKMKDTQKSLFSKDYNVRASSSETDHSQAKTEEPISPTLIGLIIIGVIFIFIGFGIIIRKIWM
ncbi:type VII secretion protein EssA [Bacillus pseudomycoides]|uniref:Type VII secretion protein EssA n=3 Tax=Bacillus pseudomycoides TaxID=64104 RepID=A0ABD6TFP5_9BACI|nr:MULTISPECIES: type VII secretion protein EssA [Bacillus]AIK38268.1 type VII secretion protein EssA [Bacillus pseudomycoides]AJI17486.1 type VII secretion protein EssA [Bacillus pseudomycoides]MEB3054631.1 type VII secretion protein EssA [Bacillus pseudomycoides]PDX97966.1 type VII secretion protein EssA [Bacillus pseudomycoides]PDZ70778.1 type VII secretion protein EssA [Bacillus pseudomycoides]